MTNRHEQVTIATSATNKLTTTSYFSSGANRDRTGDLLLAKQALSQLSYGPAGHSSLTAASGLPTEHLCRFYGDAGADDHLAELPGNRSVSARVC